MHHVCGFITIAYYNTQPEYSLHATRDWDQNFKKGLENILGGTKC